jgi:Family of unknown function (DUF5670)
MSSVRPARSTSPIRLSPDLVAFVYDDAFIINNWETVLTTLRALGLFIHIAGGLIHLPLVIAIVVIVVNLVRGGRIL